MKNKNLIQLSEIISNRSSFDSLDFNSIQKKIQVTYVRKKIQNMSLSSDILLQPSTPQPNKSIRLNSPRLKKRLNYENSENDNFNLTERKSYDKYSIIDDRMIDKEIRQRKNCLKSLESQILVYNEVLEQSKFEKNNIDNSLSEICAQFDLSNLDSQISYQKKNIQKNELEIEMFNNLKNLNHKIETDQSISKNDQIIKIQNQFINYIENDSVTEIDESNIQEKIDQLTRILSEFYDYVKNNNIQIDLNGSNQSLPISPRRIHKNLKIKKKEAVQKEPLQSPKQANQLTPQKPFIMRPNNSKIIYNTSLRENSCRDHQVTDEIDSHKSQKNIKFVNKNINSDTISTPPSNERKNILRHKRNQNSIDQKSVQSESPKFSIQLDNQINDTEKIPDEDEFYQKIPINLSIDITNQVSEPTTPTSPRPSPRHISKKKQTDSPVNFTNDENDILDLNQSSKILTEKNEGQQSGNTSTTSSKGGKSNTSRNPPKETTDSLMSKRAKGLLNAGNDGSSDSDPAPNPHNQGTGGHKKKNRFTLFDFLNNFGHVIVDNLEKAIGKESTRRKKPKKPNLSSIIDKEALKNSNINADELIGLDDSNDSDDSDSDTDSDTDSDYNYGYGDSDELDSNGNPIEGSKSNSKGKSKGKGKNRDKVGGKEESHGGHHHKKGSNPNKVNELNGLTKDQEAEILKNFENGGEIPKGYAVLVGKNGEKVIVQTVYGIEDEDDAEISFVKEAIFEEEMQLKDMEEKDMIKAKYEKVNKKHRSPPEFDYEVAEDEDFSFIIRKRQIKFHRVTVERDGRKFDERQPKPIEEFEYIEVDKAEKPSKTATKSSKGKGKSASNSNETKEEFDSSQRTELVKRYIEFEYTDVESEGGTIRKAHVPIPRIDYEWIQMKEDPTMIGKYPKQWGYRWTYGNRGKRIKVCYDKRSLVEEQTRDWKGNPTTVMKKVRMEEVIVDCDDGIKRKIKRPIQKVEFELFEVENEDGTFSIVKRPIIFTQLENGTWKRVDSEEDFFYEQVEIDGHLSIEKRHKEYELVDVECDDGKVRKVKREVQPIEYEEVIDEVTGKKKIVPRQVTYGYVIVEDENGNKIRCRREILNEDEEYEYIGSYDAEGNFTLQRQKVCYGYRYDFNGHRIRYRIPDQEIIQDEEGGSTQKEVQYETVEVELEDGRKVKVLRRKEDYEYVMVTDEKTGETKYVRQKVQYTTTTKTDENGNVITVKTKVVQDFDEVADGVDENGNVIYKKVPKEYETVTMKNDKGEVITVKRAKRYNYETVVDENGVSHQVRKEKIKPKRVRKAVKRLISFPKPLPRSKSFSYLRRYPKHPEIKGEGKGKGGVKPSTSISNLTQVIQFLKQTDDSNISKGYKFFSGLRFGKEYYRKKLLDSLAERFRKTQIDIQLINLQVDLSNAQTRTQKVQENIDFVLFEIRSKLPKLHLTKPNQITVPKPPIDGSDISIQTLISMSEMNEFHMKVKSGMLTNKMRSTLKGNSQTLADYLDKLHRDHTKAMKVVEAQQKEGDEYLATIRIYKPTPDSVAMPPETRKKLELQQNFKELDIKCKKIQKELEDAREKLVILKRQQQDKECTNEMQAGKVDTKKKVPKISLRDLKKLKSDAVKENRKVMSKLKLAEIEENNLDEKLNYIVPNYSTDEIDAITQNISQMKKTILQLKKQFRVKRKIPDEQAKHSYVLSSKEEIAEFEKRKKYISSQITNTDKKEKQLIEKINGMAKVMKKDKLRIPIDRLVTIFE